MLAEQQTPILSDSHDKCIGRERLDNILSLTINALSPGGHRTGPRHRSTKRGSSALSAFRSFLVRLFSVFRRLSLAGERGGSGPV
jgi:hypothetical protein